MGATLTEGKGPVLLAVTWTWAGIATVLYVLRTLNASVAPKDHPSLFGFRWDYVWATVAYVSTPSRDGSRLERNADALEINALIANAFLTTSVLHGTGNHQGLLSESQDINSALWSWIGQICAIMALVWGRFAVIAFLVALQGKTYRTWKRILFVVGGAQFLINAIEIVLILKQCTPTRKLWNQGIPGTCDLVTVCSKVGFLQGSKEQTLWAMRGMFLLTKPGIGAFADLFLALYPPAVIIGPLQAMKPTMKVALCLIMGGGVV